MKVSLYEMFCTDTLRHRDTARKVVERLSQIPKTDLVVIDFAKIDFASRSFLHELMESLSDRKILYQNQNEEVETMMGIISKNIESHFGDESKKHHLTAPTAPSICKG
jgi:hypothetical protein